MTPESSDAVLQFHALLVAWPRWSGLLQDDAIDALSIRAVVVRAWRVVLSSSVCGDALEWSSLLDLALAEIGTFG